MPSREPAQGLLARLIEAVLRHRLAASSILLLVVLATALGASRLQIDFSSTGFYGDASAAAQRLAAHQATWGADDDTLLVLVRTADTADPQGVLRRDRLALLAELSRSLETHEQVLAVRSIATLALPRPALPDASEVETRSVSELVERYELDQRGPTARKLLLARLPLVPTLLSAKGEATVIAVELAFSTDEVLRTRALVGSLEQDIARYDARLSALGLRRELAGVPAIRASFVNLVIHDQLRLIPASLVFIGLALLFLFRRLHGVLIPATAAALPTLMLVGLMGWAGEPIGLLNQTYFTLLPVIAVADAIHMLARYHEARADLGPGADAQRRAIVIAGSRVGLACLLTSLTTAAGFASLGLARMPILRGFGLYAALGVVLAFATVVILVPLLLSLLDEDAEPARELPGGWLVEQLVGFALRRPRWSLGLALVLVLAALLPASRVVVDNKLSGLLDPTHTTSHASEYVDAQLGGVLGLELELRAPAELDMRDPQLLALILEFETWLRAQPEVRVVDGFASTIAAAGPLLFAPAELPTLRSEIDARATRLAPFAPLEELVQADGRLLHIHAGVPDIGGVAFVDLAERAEAELQTRLAALPAATAITAYATGTTLVAYRGVNGITRDLRRSFAMVFVVVMLVIVGLFRSPWPALAALLPNGAPLLLGYAGIGLLGLELDPIAAVILTLALGIAVDDTLHIMVRTREERRAGASVEQALRRATHHSGRAVVITTVVIVAGLGLNLLASFPPLQLLGLLGSLTLSFALLFDLLVLPAVLVLLEGRGL